MPELASYLDSYYYKRKEMWAKAFSRWEHWGVITTDKFLRADKKGKFITGKKHKADRTATSKDICVGPVFQLHQMKPDGRLANTL